MLKETYIRTQKHRRNISEALKGRKLSFYHKFHISQSNKGRSVWNKGIKYPEWYKKKLKDNHYDCRNEKNPLWKGDRAGYVAKHIWIIKHYGKAIICQNPNCEYKNPKRYEWANISKEYKRDKNDYIQLCPSCHRKWDAGKLLINIKMIELDKAYAYR